MTSPKTRIVPPSSSTVYNMGENQRNLDELASLLAQIDGIIAGGGHSDKLESDIVALLGLTEHAAAKAGLIVSEHTPQPETDWAKVDNATWGRDRLMRQSLEPAPNPDPETDWDEVAEFFDRDRIRYHEEWSREQMLDLGKAMWLISSINRNISGQYDGFTCTKKQAADMITDLNQASMLVDDVKHEFEVMLVEEAQAEAERNGDLF